MQQESLRLSAREINYSSTVKMADAASALRSIGHKVVDLSAGRAPEPTHLRICLEATKAMQEGHTHQTPARGLPSYLNAASELLATESGLSYSANQQIIATSGCKNGLYLSLLALLDPGDEMLIEDPCFVSYAPTIELMGATVKPVALRQANRYRWTVDQLEGAITNKTRAIVICSPHNPLGVVHSPEDLDVIADVARRFNLWVIADEVYDAVTWGGRKHLPIASRPGMAERTLGLRSTTKTFSMGGWRLGFVYGPSNVIERMTAIQGHLATCVSSINQLTGICAYSPEMLAQLSVSLWPVWESRCRYACDRINAIDGLKTYMPEGGFYAWTDISATGMDSETFAMTLLNTHQVSLVPGSAFGEEGEGFVRITSVKSESDLDAGLDKLEQFVRELI